MADELPVDNDGAVDTPGPETDYEKRWKETHAWGNSLNEQLANERKVWEDEEALRARLQEKVPHWFEDDEPEDEYEDEPDEAERPLTRAEFKAYQEEQEAERKAQAGRQAFETDFVTFVADRPLSPQGERAIRSTPGLNSAEDLKKAVDDWFAYEESLKGKPRPRVPHVPANGQAATQVPDWSGMSKRDIDKYMAEKAQGMLQQS